MVGKDRKPLPAAFFSPYIPPAAIGFHLPTFAPAHRARNRACQGDIKPYHAEIYYTNWPLWDIRVIKYYETTGPGDRVLWDSKSYIWDFKFCGTKKYLW